VATVSNNGRLWALHSNSKEEHDEEHADSADDEENDDDDVLYYMASGNSSQSTASSPENRAEAVSLTADQDDEKDLIDYGAEYRHKKQMSADVFRYFIYADAEQIENLGVDIDPAIQVLWQAEIAANPREKLDDVGDALLHCLNEQLCGGKNDNVFFYIGPICSAFAGFHR
jgi:hypothetical protein